MNFDIKGVELDDNHYVIKQALYRNKYRVEDSSGKTVLKTKQKLLKMKEEFPFTNSDEDTVFSIKAKNLMDIAGDYALIDEETGETFATLEKKFTFFKHDWKVKNSEGQEIARIESASFGLEVMRSLVGFLNLIPQKYDISRGEDKIGSLNGRFKLRDVYDLKFDEKVSEPLIAAAVAVDALEHN
ncbi:MAG: hypothetical protein H8Z69_04790 [Nanohaloarchaea archaeon]|nr:hypothetical protein [Candidatus Nanohaloarchaea archaeon]